MPVKPGQAQNVRRGHYELGFDAPPALRVAAAFTELAQTIWPWARHRFNVSADLTTQQCPPGCRPVLTLLG